MATIKAYGGVEIAPLVAAATKMVNDINVSWVERLAAAELLVALDTRRMVDRMESSLHRLHEKTVDKTVIETNLMTPDLLAAKIAEEMERIKARKKML